MSELRIGFVGVGRMGAPMASRLIDAGYETTVFDASLDAVEAMVSMGARSAETPAALAAAVDVVFMSLPNPEIVTKVGIGEDGLASADGAKIVVDLSTTGAPTEQRLAAGLKESGITLVDCPVSGGVGGAETGKLTLMVAGDCEAIATVRPCLDRFGRVFVVGSEPGMGQTIKVINNLMSVTALSIASEALVLGRKAGLDPEVMIDVINAGSGSSNATATKIPKFVLTRSFDFGFAMDLSAKDVRLCMEESERLGVPMLVGNAARQLLTIARGQLGGDADLTEIIKPIEGWSGLDDTPGR